MTRASLRDSRRELKEESGLDVVSDKILKSVGTVWVQFLKDGKCLEIHAFRVDVESVEDVVGVEGTRTDGTGKVNEKIFTAESKLQETEEMRCEWHEVNSIPWDRCISDAEEWYPNVWPDMLEDDSFLDDGDGATANGNGSKTETVFASGGSAAAAGARGAAGNGGGKIAPETKMAPEPTRDETERFYNFFVLEEDDSIMYQKLVKNHQRLVERPASAVPSPTAE